MANTFFQKIEENRAENKTIKELYVESNFRSSLDKKAIDSIVKRQERSYPNMFTKRGMKAKILKSSYIDSIKYYCRVMQADNGIQQIISDDQNEGKYQFLLKYIKEIINPLFSRSIFDVKL